MTKQGKPETPAEWQEACDLAEMCLLIHDARLYGLVEGGPDFNIGRCWAILTQAKALGYTPRDQETLIREVLPAFLAPAAAPASGAIQ